MLKGKNKMIKSNFKNYVTDEERIISKYPGEEITRFFN